VSLLLFTGKLVLTSLSGQSVAFLATRGAAAPSPPKRGAVHNPGWFSRRLTWAYAPRFRIAKKPI